MQMHISLLLVRLYMTYKQIKTFLNLFVQCTVQGLTRRIAMYRTGFLNN